MWRELGKCQQAVLIANLCQISKFIMLLFCSQNFAASPAVCTHRSLTPVMDCPMYFWISTFVWLPHLRVLEQSSNDEIIHKPDQCLLLLRAVACPMYIWISDSLSVKSPTFVETTHSLTFTQVCSGAYWSEITYTAPLWECNKRSKTSQTRQCICFVTL